MDTDAWLKELGLGQYAPAFAENDVDGETLAKLTGEDLKEIGVTSVGHRRKLLEAIARLGRDDERADSTPFAAATPRPPDSYTPRYLAERILQSRSVIEGERKQVTVLFADIKGSLELIQGSDPEDAQAIFDQAIRTMMEGVHRYEGTVNKVLGDGIMALFGAPISQEDHAVRACFAALAMQEAIGGTAEKLRQTYGVEVQIRIGLNSGEVVVRAIGNDLSMDYDAIGQTTHLAGRMEQLAIPGTIRLTADTLRLAEGFLQVRPLGPVAVKGFEQPVEIFELTGAGPARTRFQTALARGLTRFVGRVAELEALTSALDRAAHGQGQLFAVVGEAGVGKSRLFHEFIHSHRTEGMAVLETRSVSYGRATSFLPIIQLLKAYFRIEDRDDARRVQEKVNGKLLTLDEELKPVLPALHALLGVPVEDTVWEKQEPSQRRRRTLEAVKAILAKESRIQPLVIAFEDLHWIDGETQAFLDNVVESLPTLRVLLLVNYRPEYRHEWASKACYTQQRIDPLPPEGAEEMLDGLLGVDPELGPLKHMLVSRTEGNPFFVEECARSLVETGVLSGDPGAYVPTTDVATVEVPATVQGVLVARIDRLPGEDKQLLQTASVIGKDVPFGLLQAIAGLPEDQLRGRLARLQANEMLYESQLFPEPEYTFKHALTHEVAYGSLLHGRKRALHRWIAETIESTQAAHLPERCERLAHHFTEAGEVARAVPYWQQAGQRSIERSASADAIAQLGKGLKLVRRLPETRERDRQELAFLVALGVPLQITKGAGSPDVRQVYEAARTLSDRIGETPLLFPALWGLWRFHRTQSDLFTARKLADELLGLADRSGDIVLRLQAHHAQWTTLYYLGEIAAARKHVDKGLALYDPQKHSTQAFLISGHDPRTCGEGTAALILWLQGYPDQAVESSSRAREHAESLDQPSSLALALEESCLVHLFRREPEQVGDYSGALLSFAAEWDLARESSIAKVLQGWAQVLRDQAAEGMRLLREAIDLRHSAGLQVEEAHLSTALVHALSLTGQREAALGLLSEAIEAAERFGGRFWLAELLRLKADLTVSTSDESMAETMACHRKAIDIAHRQGAKSLELRCATSLARSMREQGRAGEARDLLRPVHDWFTEGFDTPDLKDAKALLDELA